LPKPGDVIDGKYQVDHRIGSGAMSVVYQVTHRVTQKRFAMKWLLPELAGKSDLAERFLREARVGGRFDHPNVVEVYDVGASNGGFYMVLELLSGESLQQRIARMELSWPDACRLLLPCMRAVAHAHHHGIVHRDLKPANIFVCAATKTSTERAKVLDFGLAKLARLPGEQSLLGTRSGVVMGTPHYMPLEQMRGEAVDRRVDVYAFGVTLYQALSGRFPYQAATFGDLVLAMASEAPMPLERWVPRLPEGVGAAIGRALARHPNDRYADLTAFVEALEPFVPADLGQQSVRRGSVEVQSEPSLAPKTRAPRISEPPPERSHRFWLLPALAAAAMLASISVVTHRRAELGDVTAPAKSQATTRAQPTASHAASSAAKTPPANLPPCGAEASAPSHAQPAPNDLNPRVPEPHYEGWTLPSGAPYEVRPTRTTDLHDSTRTPQPATPQPSARARRQWRQARAYVAHAPPLDPRAEEPTSAADPQSPARRATPERPRPPRWLPLRTDEF
jgi:serine/threonine-protein kinase